MSILLGFLDFQHGAAFIRSALGAGAMGQLLFVAVRALREPGGGKKVVGTAEGGAARGVAPFRIRHDAIPFDSCPLACLAGARNVSAPEYPGRIAARGDAPCSKELIFQDLIRPRNPVSASQRGSLGPASQEQGCVLRLAPQRGQSPLQSGLHSVLTGRDKSTCSRSTSSSNRLSF